MMKNSVVKVSYLHFFLLLTFPFYIGFVVLLCFKILHGVLSASKMSGLKYIATKTSIKTFVKFLGKLKRMGWNRKQVGSWCA